MPAKAPLTPETVRHTLALIGGRIRDRRKRLRISANAAAQAGGMSRVTLHRIEKGEPSVTMGAYLTVMAALGMDTDIAGKTDGELAGTDTQKATPNKPLPARIVLARYPQLAALAWHAPGAVDVTPEEAFALYERNWRHVDVEAMDADEKDLLDQLAQIIGKGHTLV
jgi:transcriptional regulator with XRE-family HTH domain